MRGDPLLRPMLKKKQFAGSRSISLISSQMNQVCLLKFFVQLVFMAYYFLISQKIKTLLRKILKYVAR